MAIFETFFFFQNWKTQLSKNIWIYIIAFNPIEIQTQQAPQNDRRNLSFVKDTNVVGNRMTRKGPLFVYIQAMFYLLLKKTLLLQK